MGEAVYRSSRTSRDFARQSRPTLGPSTGQPPSLIQLQQLAGNQAVSRLVAKQANSRSFVQRAITYGTDPTTLITAGSKDLLYGLNIPRALTKGRLSGPQKQELRTIDDYNRHVGINALMTSANAALGLYDVRAELASTAAWALATPQPLAAHPNAGDLQAWITMLRAHGVQVGLEDLGTRAKFFADKIKRKGRFKKNRKESQANDPKADRLTANDVRDFLNPAHTKGTGQTALAAMPAAKQAALHAWVYRAFFRRTSKLGQDFTVAQGGTVHFNTVADPNYNPATGANNMQDRGLDTMSQTGNNAKNRSITVSELRHAAKLAKAHPGSFNVYGER